MLLLSLWATVWTVLNDDFGYYLTEHQGHYLLLISSQQTASQGYADEYLDVIGEQLVNFIFMEWDLALLLIS